MARGKHRDDATLSLPFEAPLGLREEVELLLKSGGFEIRPQQVEMILELIEGTGRTIALADTGEGKSVMYIAAALFESRRGNRAVLLTRREILVQQFAAEARRFPELAGNAVLGVSGETPVRQREKLYLIPRKLIVTTPEVMLNDLARGIFPRDGISLVALDELHHAQGRDAYVKLIPLLKEWGVRLIGMTATAAKNRAKRKAIQYRLEPESVHRYQSEQRLVEEEVVEVHLSDELKRGAEIFLEEAQQVWTRLRATFADRRSGQRRSPFVGFDERERVLRWIFEDAARDEKLTRKRRFLWAQHGLICSLYEQLAMMSTAVFCDSFGYSHSFQRLKPSVQLAELENKRREGKRFFEKAVVENQRLWSVYAELARGTLHEALTRSAGRSTTWQDVWGAAFPKESADERSTWELAETFFERTLEQAAERGYDHPVFYALEDLLEKHRELLEENRCIVFTGSRRHARYLATAANRHFAYLGVRAVWSAGAKRAALKHLADENLTAFNGGRANVMFATDRLREGLDVRRALLGIDLAPPASPVKRRQGRGRVGRDQGMFAKFYYVTVAGTPAETRPLIGAVLEKRMLRDMRDFGRLLAP